jgi:hypothetical protein
VVQQPFTLMSIDIRVTSLLKALFGAAGSLTVSAESSIYNCARGVDGYLFQVPFHIDSNYGASRYFQARVLDLDYGHESHV